MKTNKVLAFAAVTLMCAAVLLHSSCSKNPRGVYIVKGKVMDSCLSNKPFANKDIVLSIKVGGSSVNIAVHDSIGYGKTDAAGNFNIACENWGGGEISIDSKGKGFITYGFIGSSQSTKKGMEGQTFDLGTKCIHE